MEQSPFSNPDAEPSLNAYMLETSKEDRLGLQKAILEYSENFLESLAKSKAYEQNGYATEAQDGLFGIDGEKYPIEKLLSFLAKRVDKPGINTASGGHLGYIPGGGIYESALGDYLAAAINKYAGVFFASPGAVRIENSLIQWAGKLVGYSTGFGGNLTSGGSIANLIAISTARQAKNIKSRDIETAVIYTTRQTHHSLLKAFKLCGLEECVLRVIPQDQQYRMITEELEKQIEEDIQSGLRPFLIIANAGSTDVGAIDPLEILADVAKHYNIWLHVDAAYGGFFLLTDYGKRAMRGIERADSVILDPHKALFLSYGSGIVLIKNIEHLAAANSYEANYMQDTKSHQNEYSPAELSPELSKHFRGLRMWLPLKLHGIAPFKSYLEEKLELANYLHQKLQELKFEVGPKPQISTVLFRFLPKHQNANAYNTELVKAIHADGRVFISSTTLNGNVYLRAAIVSFRTHKSHIDLLLLLLQEQLDELVID